MRQYSRVKIIVLIAIIAIVGVIAGLVIKTKPASVVYKIENVKCGSAEIVLGTAERRTATQDPILLFYFHGLGQTFTEPFKLPAKKTFAQSALEEYPFLTIAACNYSEKIVWYNADNLTSATCGINHILSQMPTARIVLAGTSMGGCAALTYAATAPAEIRNRIIGVVAIYACGDLTKLYQLTQEKRATDGLLSGFGGPPERNLERYNRASLIPNLTGLSKNMRVYLISANRDVVIPTVMQDELYKVLLADNIACKLETFEGTHLGFPVSGSFERGLHFVLDFAKPKR
jgi:pimeloyl-ACP methyl ester carboxylesterase